MLNEPNSAGVMIMELEIRMYPLTVEIGTQICKDIAGLPKHFTLHKLGERAPFF